VRALPPLLVLLAGCSFKPTFDGQQCSLEGDCAPGLECCKDNVCRADCDDVDMGAVGDGGLDAGSDGTCEDADQDGVCDDIDNCPDVPNPGQGDCDGVNGGDACDPVYEARCYGLRATFSSGGGVTEGTPGRAVGVLGESSHSISTAPGFRLRGGLLPRAPRAE